jgi:Tol biopolymer transport system component
MAALGVRSGSGGRAELAGRYVFSLAYQKNLVDGYDHYRLFVANADGSHLRRLTSGARNDTYPAWSPDGTKIAFARDDPGSPGSSNIWVIDANGNGAKQLTHDKGALDFAESWSPDGKTIVYSGPNRAIWAMNPDGSNQHVLIPPAKGHTNYLPSFSRDGVSIVFVQLTPVRNAATLGAIMIAKADGSGVRRITSNAFRFSEAEPRFSPDGSRLAYTWETDKQALELHVMGANGTGDLKTGLTGADAAWSPTGDAIACFCWIPNKTSWGLQVYDTTAHKLTQVKAFDLDHWTEQGLDWSRR